MFGFIKIIFFEYKLKEDKISDVSINFTGANQFVDYKNIC